MIRQNLSHMKNLGSKYVFFYTAEKRLSLFTSQYPTTQHRREFEDPDLNLDILLEYFTYYMNVSHSSALSPTETQRKTLTACSV